jgi:DNA-binding MarR family transcriptional regulator
MTKQILIQGLDRDARRTLLALYELAAQDRRTPATRLDARQVGCIDPPALARRLGLSPASVLRNLQTLDARGLVWAERCRLTLRGLASAARLSALRARAEARPRARERRLVAHGRAA